MTDEKRCLHCQLLDVVKAWALATGERDEKKIAHADGIHILGSMVGAAWDVISMAPPAERRELFGFLFQQIMDGGLQSGLIQTVEPKNTKHTIN